MITSPPTEPAKTPVRRFLDRSANSPTLVSAGSRLDGTLTCAGDLSVAGEITGSGHIQGMLTLADGGNWQGEIHCAQALLAGQFDGQLTVTGKLEIRRSARIKGQISAQHIAIAEGAVVEAELRVLSGAEIQRFTEQRKR